MTRADLVGIFQANGSEYQAMLAERALDRVAAGDAQAYDALAGLAVYKRAAAIPEIVDMAGRVSTGPIGFAAIQAAIAERYPAEAPQIMRDAMNRRG